MPTDREHDLRSGGRSDAEIAPCVRWGSASLGRLSRPGSSDPSRSRRRVIWRVFECGFDRKERVAYICVMVQSFNNPPATPKRALRRRAKLDTLLDPDLFKALSDPNRATLLACLIKCGRACSASEVAECCSVDFSMVTRRLSALACAGALDAHKKGRTVWYTANSGELAATFRKLADAIDEWATRSQCADASCRKD